MIDEKVLEHRLSARFGLDVVAKRPEYGMTSGVSFRVVGQGIDQPTGFMVMLSGAWRSIEATFLPDPFAKALLATMGSPDSQRRNEFAALVKAFGAAGIRSTVKIDEREVSSATLPDGAWKALQISCRRLSDKTDEQREAEDVGGACLALVLSLLPMAEEEDEATPLAQGLPEGALSRVLVNRYERRPANRAAAIAAHGAVCCVCGFDYSTFYGEIGEGFIEVHHRTPVSSMGPGYVVDPVKDLVPLCANCHQMVHRRDPPIPPEDLKRNLSIRGVVKA